MTTNTPPPGSPEAIALGCCCPVLDNGHGRGYRFVQGHPVLYVYGYVQCTKCGKWVAEHWLVRHRKTGCRLGGHREKPNVTR